MGLSPPADPMAVRAPRAVISAEDASARRPMTDTVGSARASPLESNLVLSFRGVLLFAACSVELSAPLRVTPGHSVLHWL